MTEEQAKRFEDLFASILERLRAIEHEQEVLKSSMLRIIMRERAKRGPRFFPQELEVEPTDFTTTTPSDLGPFRSTDLQLPPLETEDKAK